MYRFINVRFPVLFALVFSVTTFILSLLVLLAGRTPSFLLDAYIVLVMIYFSRLSIEEVLPI